jgi:septal ring factor EnvC (AmiA/AmiB activator)
MSKDLEKKKLNNIEKLNYSKLLLEQTYKSRAASLNKLTLIQRNIELRLKIISNISDELAFIKNDIAGNHNEINILEREIQRIKSEYSKLIIAAARNLDSEYALMYIFSSHDFNQAYQRIKYAKYLQEYRRELVLNILKEEMELKNKNLELFDIKTRNEILLEERKDELVKLATDRKFNLEMINTLQAKESDLKKQIREVERIQAELETAIRKLIEEEADKARKVNKISILTPEQTLISSDFFKNKGRLPWPSEQGVITGKFGEQNHPILKGIKINSNGIDITTLPGASIRSVFDGEVTKVIAILGANYTVIIKHGEYRTVYQNLINVRVSAGDVLKTKDIIGTVYKDPENVSKLHFELWKDKSTQNPELWLSK